MDLVGKKVLVIGTGVSGIGSAHLLCQNGAIPVLLDENIKVKEDDVRNKLDEAEQQIIEKGYGLENLGNRELIQIACVFNGDKNKRQITMYKKIESTTC